MLVANTNLVCVGFLGDDAEDSCAVLCRGVRTCQLLADTAWHAMQLGPSLCKRICGCVGVSVSTGQPLAIA